MAASSSTARFDSSNLPLKVEPDAIISNRVINPNSNSANTWNTGLGVFYNAGIILGDGLSDIIAGNTIIDTNASPLMQYGICLTGTSTGLVVVNSPVVIGNSIVGYTAADGIGIRSASALTGTPAIGPNVGSTASNTSLPLAVETLTDAATVTPNSARGGGKLLTLSQSTTIANPTGSPWPFQHYILRITSSSSQSLAWGLQFRGSTGLPLPAATTGSGKTDYFGFQWDTDSSTWDLIALSQGY